MNANKNSLQNKFILYIYKYINKYKKIINKLTVFLLFSIIYIIFFSPIIFSDKLLAPGDAITQSVPAFYSPRKLWTDLLYAGFPVAADPTVQTWYPLSIFFSFIPNSWNYFVISAYVLASCFTYGYVYKLTDSKLAAGVGGLIYGMSGFMMAHLSHTSMIHSAAWMPLIIWSLEELRYKFTIQWFLVGCFAIACCILAGHPQIAVYSVALAAVYALILGWNALVGKWKFFKFSLTVLVVGIALSATQILPTTELSSLGLRTEMSFQEFNSFSLPPVESIKLLFPYFLGGSTSWPYQMPYFGSWNLPETTGYVGLLTIILAIVGLLCSQNVSISRFWGFTALVSFLLTLGSATPLSWLIFHLPVFNKFRVPARHFIEMTLAFSVLAGIGVAAIQKRTLTNHLLKRIILFITGIFIAILAAILLLHSNIIRRIQEIAGQEGIKQFTFIPWSNPAIGIPILIFLVSVILLIYWSKLPSSKILKFLVLLVMIFDLGSFGWFDSWQEFSPSKNFLTPILSTKKYADILSSSHQRILPVRGALGAVEEIPVNMSRLWGVPNASGYGPLILSRVSQLLSMNTPGDVWGNWAAEANRSLDIMSIRYVFTSKNPSPVSVFSVDGISWSNEDIATPLGFGCNQQHPSSVKFSIPSAQGIQTVTGLGIVSSLACSTVIQDNTEVLQVRLTESSGKVITQNLLAGRDTSEWAYDCSDVLPLMQHSRARVFKSYPVERDGVPKCEGHSYFTVLPLNELNEVKSVELNWLGTSGAIMIQKISLINDKIKEFYPITISNMSLAKSANWSHIEDINQTRVYENLRAMPRAWLVPEIISLKPDEVLSAIKSSKLPDGRNYEPSEVALIEESADFKAQNLDSSATTKITKLEDTHIQIQTNSKYSSFLILSDIYYPGWQAKIDGKLTKIFPTNYVQRGIILPAGNHLVEFEFKPRSFHIGLGITIASLVFIGYLYFRHIYKANLVT